jgi:hypothetical protein
MIYLILGLESTPILHIDLSDKSKEDIVVLNHRLEELGYHYSEGERKIKHYEEQFRFMTDEVK